MIRPVPRRSRSSWIGVLVVLAAVWLCPAFVEAQAAPTLDHFRCYAELQGPSVVEPVSLKDQFTLPGALQDALVYRPVRFCNPVEKTTPDGVVTPIQDVNAHLQLFLIAPSVIEPTRSVTFKNQFGRRRLLTFNPVVLAVPTAKNTQPFPDNLDHFLCYQARGGNVNVVVNLRDQFQSGPATVLRPFLFCNPVSKLHRDVQVPIKNPDSHLVCYRTMVTEFAGQALVRNQFISGTDGFPITVGSGDILCVPTQKLRFTAVP
ncbi:MAG: hypothetical protein DMF80_07850 [Acidobacteria bacterium]|nr:MAG: hypothetical protein DMF80_07850 [Acidobacteriota bacterium]PYQ23557.1 MAG: hypothetical protein DMF81_08435 [Acidobacteriota bacterium]